MVNDTPADAQLRAAHGGYRCRACGREGRLADAILTVCRNTIIHAICVEPCAREHEVVVAHVERGTEVRPRQQRLIVPASQLPVLPPEV